MESPRKSAVLLALAAAAVVWFGQFLTVHYNYGGNWTGLFCIRPGMPVPAFLKSEDLYRFQNSDGYDGQVFHLIAHDPWMRKGSRGAIAGAAFRYQRIFVPALTWTIALGQDRWIHPAYFAVILGFIFLGVYWSALMASRLGLRPAWGLLFAVTPAAITSADRMTADVALAAFAVGFALYCVKPPGARMLAILACAALTRETALPIIAGYAIYLASRRKWRSAVLAAMAVLPALAWFVYVSRGATPEAVTYMNWLPLAGLTERLLHPAVYALSPFKDEVATIFDYVSLAAVVLALAATARMALRREWSALVAAIYGCALAIVFLKSRSVWEEAYAFGRVLTPFLILVAFQAVARRPWIALLPIVLVDSRLALNLAGEASGIVRGMMHLLK